MYHLVLAHLSERIVAASNVPSFSPDLNTPLAPLLTTVLNVIAGFVLFASVIIFIVGVSKAGFSMGGRSQMGVRSGGLMMLGSIMVIVVILLGGSFLNGWVHLFGV